MLIMGSASFLIGLVPGASVIGPWGAVILVLLRICQGIAVGGEWGGAALMALEHADASKRGFSASFVNAGAPSGALLGSLMMGLFALLPQDQFFAWGWRIPFLFSGRAAGHRHVRAVQGHRVPGLRRSHGEGRSAKGRQAAAATVGGAAPPEGSHPGHAGCRRGVRFPGHHGHVRADLRRRVRRDRPVVDPVRLLRGVLPGHLRGALRRPAVRPVRPQPGADHRHGAVLRLPGPVLLPGGARATSGWSCSASSSACSSTA